MLSITIDAGTLAPPFSNPTADSVYLFVEQILEWKDALDAGTARILTSIRTPEVLIHCGLYPERPLLTTLLRQTAVGEYDANTIAVLVDTLLTRSLKLEDEFLVSDVLTSNLSIIPSVFEGYNPAALREECERCAVVVAILRTHASDPTLPNHAIALRARGGNRLARVRCVLDIVEHTRPDLASLPVSPGYFEGSVLLCHSFEDYVQGIEELTVWQNAAEDEDLITAIRIALFKERVKSGARSGWNDLTQFSVGRQFFTSIEACRGLTNAGLAQRTLRAVVETIEHVNLSATHRLRAGPGGNEPPRMRGDDVGWRRDIDRDCHLHYWECATGFVELASVVHHNDFTIPG